MVINTTTTVYGRIGSRSLTNDPKTKKQKVYGLGFPIGKRLQGGFFRKTSGIELVKGNVRQILMTQRGERVMLPNYGANLKKFLFQPMDEDLVNAIKDEILTSLNRYARGVEVLRLRISPSSNTRSADLQTLRVNLLIKISEIENVITEVDITI
jgi:phage baseplate assembly protein W